jgi:hypothetical protein
MVEVDRYATVAVLGHPALASLLSQNMGSQQEAKTHENEVSHKIWMSDLTEDHTSRNTARDG